MKHKYVGVTIDSNEVSTLLAAVAGIPTAEVVHIVNARPPVAPGERAGRASEDTHPHSCSAPYNRGGKR